MKNNTSRTEKIILQKIINHCNEISEILKRIENDYENFTNDFVYQYAVSTCILRIGELTVRLSDEFKTKHNLIPWQLIKAMRNIHAHDYENLNLKLIWTTITKDVPELKAELQKIITEELEGEEI